MNADELFKAAVGGGKCPSDLSSTSKVLWSAKAGDWDKAHDDCQNLPDPAGAWIHAWLHRQEGDYGNACYWYSRAGKPAVAEDASLDEELLQIAEALLD